MKKLMKLAAVAALVIGPFTAAGAAKAEPFKECEPEETNCACGIHVDTSRGLKYTQVRVQYC